MLPHKADALLGRQRLSIATATFMQTKRMGQAMGKSGMEAEQLATTSLKGRVAVQSAIVSMKDITGRTIILLSGAVLLVLLLPYCKNETT